MFLFPYVSLCLLIYILPKRTCRLYIVRQNPLLAVEVPEPGAENLEFPLSEVFLHNDSTS